MLTKEECLEALTEIKMYGSINIPLYSLEVIENLIGEHFSNTPLEWEEIKEGDFVFDKDFNGLGGEWLKVYMKHITNYGEKVLMCGACGSDETQTRSYKEDRFYRKEVQE